ncbi:MAG: aminotransferase class I/II-fold pyridoxal phosphate-dependent enzyme [Desulfobacteraceae bacterium]|nr:MAG: aminotransferase class I/II-fold pyridoxal phosphate-dependent enzyme [Desulfobacteraceae bacterium]
MRLPPFRLERYFARYEFNARYLLCCSDCESMTIRDVLSLEPEAAERFQNSFLGYTDSQGSPALRQAISSLYTDIRPDQILVHSGAEEAIFLFMHAVLKSGDHVIVHFPAYQSLIEVARSIGCEVTPWVAEEQNNWALDVEALQRQIRHDTRAIVINMPHNPTGYLMKKDAFHRVVQLADERKIFLFSDEVYRESEYTASDRLPAACEASAHGVSLGVMSKTYGLAGLRIGWIATRDQSVSERMAALKDYTTICNSAPSELLAEVALRHRFEIIERNLGIIKSNLTVLDRFFAGHKETFTWKPPLAGPIAFPGLNGDVEEFCRRLVAEAGVLLLPGTVFTRSSNRFRIGFGRRNMPEAVERLDRFLKEAG